MKISAKQYARGLVESLEGQKAATQKKTISRFLCLLRRRGQFNLADKIIVELNEIILARQGVMEAEVVSAQALNGSALQTVEKMVKLKTGCQEVRLVEKIDTELLGGAVVSYQDKVNDFSFKYFLSKIKQGLIN